MSLHEWMQIVFFAGILVILTPIFGTYLAQVYEGKRTILHPLFSWLENLSYKLAGVSSKEEMTSSTYLKAVLWFNLLGFLAVFFLQLLQPYLPLNPQNLPSVPIGLAFNTAVSFMTNTNWQAYAGETTLSYATQMAGLTVQNFMSAATGAGVALALIRGFTRKETPTIGNFWVDLVRTVVYILLPLSILMAMVLVTEGVIQSLSPYVEATTLEGAKQMIPLGPVASQEAIKQLGSNGGGFFGANSAHPFENPTGLTDFIEMLAIVLLPAALFYAYGIMIKSTKQGWLLFILMFAFWIGGVLISCLSAHVANPVLGAMPVLEGVETRIGSAYSMIWTVSTTVTSNGSVNAMISSLSPLAGGVALFNMMLEELIFGGIGVGLCSMIMFVLLTVFLAGLMVGRTPEYLGKKIEKKEVQWVMVAVLSPGILILIGAGISSMLPVAVSSLGNQGPHGLTEILYAFTSAAANNGSAFAGLNANTDYYNYSLGIAMLLGRAVIVIPCIAIAGLLAQKKVTPESSGTFSTDTTLFIMLLAGVILIVGALTFFPALALGPVVEHLLMLKDRSF